MTPLQRAKNIKVLMKAREAKAIKLAEERMASPPQPKDVHLAPGQGMKIGSTELQAQYLQLVDDFEDAVRMHDNRGAGDPDDAEEKERYYNFLKLQLQSFGELF